MSDVRIHRAAAPDGTPIAGRVAGNGPPLVLVHGGPHDGDIAWEALVPHLVDRFTCYLPSTRGRGLSGDDPDHSPPRLEGDIAAFVDSIGEPVGLVGWSTGATKALGVAATSDAVAAVVAYEPTVVSIMREDDLAEFAETFEAVGTAAADGRLVDAARAFHAMFATEEEVTLAGARYFDRCAAIVPALLQEAHQSVAYDGPRASDPEVLSKISAPLLLLRGQQTRLRTLYADTDAYIAQHVADTPDRRELPGLGHFAPLVSPGRVADELISFLATARPTS